MGGEGGREGEWEGGNLYNYATKRFTQLLT